MTFELGYISDGFEALNGRRLADDVLLALVSGIPTLTDGVDGNDVPPGVTDPSRDS